MNFITYDMFKMLWKMHRRSRPAKRRVPAELSAPVEEHIDESVNVPIPPPVPLEPSAGYAPLRFQQQQQGEGRNEYQVQKRAQTFEDQMLQFMGENKKPLNFHEQNFSELEASNTNSQIFQKTTNASLKNLETQIGQLALTLQNQTKDAFPSDTKKNPKDCMPVQLRSGKELEKEKSEKDEGNKGGRSLRNAETLEKKRKLEQQQEEERSEKKAQNSMPAVPFLQRL